MKTNKICFEKYKDGYAPQYGFQPLCSAGQSYSRAAVAGHAPIQL